MAILLLLFLHQIELQWYCMTKQFLDARSGFCPQINTTSPNAGVSSNEDMGLIKSVL